MHDVCLGHRAHVHEEFLVPWTAPVLGSPGGACIGPSPMSLALTLCVEEMRAQISEVCW
jgi:hypothetical protein